MEVVRVPEDHVGAERPHLVRMECLDRPLRPDRHEGRSADVAVRGRQDTGACGAVHDVDAKRQSATIASPNE
jgi:hypothetical protein